MSSNDPCSEPPPAAPVQEWRAGPQQARADALREALSEIADLKSLTATPVQFARHLQRIASRALTADAKAEIDPPAQAGEDARDAARWRWAKEQFRVFSLDIGGQHSYVATAPFGRIRGPSIAAAVDAAIRQADSAKGGAGEGNG